MEDKEITLASGSQGLVGVLALLAAIIYLISIAVAGQLPLLTVIIVPLVLIWLISLNGFVVNNPNEARIVQLFGRYIGTVRAVGFMYGNPFYSRTLVSLRVRTFETGMGQADGGTTTGGQHRQPLKVNDADGTPIEIAAVVVWKVVGPADAVFTVDNYEEFVKIQADAALRNLASRYHYDAPEVADHSLRGHIEEVAAQLRQDLQVRMKQAGVEVLEARISYLAYAPEIAAAMLQRQQAGAIIAARAQIVTGAVGIVQHALEMLKERKMIELNGERQAAMVSNLLIVLCGHTSPQPVLNTGTPSN